MKRAGFLAAAALLALIPVGFSVSNAASGSGVTVHPTATSSALTASTARVSAARVSAATVSTTTVGTATVSAAKPLAGLTIAIDPGHQLGNATHPRQINRKVWVGLWKICNTTGTATNRGYPEATFNFAVALRLRAALQALGARVVMTRYTNSSRAWGPCINYRGAFGTAQHAVLKVSIHADGAPARDRGFHIITPKLRHGYTDDIYAASRRLGLAMRSGMVAGGISLSNYISHGWSVRGDQGTLNMSNIPTIIVETGNMRNARDAALEASSAGRLRYAKALLRGIRLYLHR